MNIVFEGIEISACFIEGYLLYLIFDGLFENYRKFQSRKCLIYLTLLECLLTRFCNHISLFSYGTIFICAFYMSISAVFLYRVHFAKLLAISSFYLLCIIMVDAFFISLFSNVWSGQETLTEILSKSDVARMIVLSVDKASDILLYLLLKKYIHRISSEIRYTYIILIFSCIAFIGYAFLFERMFEALSFEMTGMWFTSILLLLFGGVMTYYIMANREEKMKLFFSESRNQFLEENYRSARENYMKNAKLYHDLNNHLNVLYQILDEGDNEGAKEYIEKISEPIKQLSKTVWTGVDVVDVILNSKIEKMEQKNISCECNVEFPKHTNLLAHDICTILANLLDNAIEAAEQSGNPGHILLIIRRVEHFLLIKISNTCMEEKKPFVLFPLTTKDNKELHGWGLSNVRDAVDKYNGTMKCTREKDQFTVNIMLFFEMVPQKSDKEEKL